MEEEAQVDVRQYLDIVHRRKSLIAATTAVLLSLSLLVAFLLPAVFRAQATILIEQPDIPKDVVRSMITSYADERIEMINQRVNTTSNLLEIIKKHDLYKEERERQPLEAVVDSMRKDIKLEKISADVVDPANGRPSKATIAFQLSYDSRSPRLALDVTNDLVSLFLNENIKTRTEVAMQTSQFFADEAAKLAARIKELEEKLAAFKEKNAGKLPEFMSLNLQLMDRAEQDLGRIEGQIRTLEERKAYLESDLSRIKPNTSLISETGERILGPGDRLKVLRTEYMSISARYSAKHPDVVKIKKEIESLEREVGGGGYNREAEAQLNGQRAELAELRKRYSTDHPDVRKLERTIASLETEVRQSSQRKRNPATEAGDNPAYFQIKANIDAVTGEMRSLKREQEGLQRKIKSFEEKLQDAPNVESVYSQITREYEHALAQHKEIVAKQMEAQVSQTLETERKGERFTLIEPPLYPEKPAKPNRLAIALLGFILSTVGGIGSAAVAEGLDQSVHGSRGIMAVLNQPPLSVIPYIETEVDTRHRAMYASKLAIGATMSVLVFMIVVHTSFKPLDVLWYQVLTRLGLRT